MPLDQVVTISTLIKKDLHDAYYLPMWPSSFSKGYRFLNTGKYQVYDCPPPSLTFNQQLFPFRNLPAAGEEIFILLDHQPPTFLTEHWKRWLPKFPQAKLKTVDDGLKDDVKIVTYGAIEAISKEKHSVDPDVLYRVQLKSEIPKIGVPFTARTEENNAVYPCVVKVDQSWSGQGSMIAKNREELRTILSQVRQQNGWKEKIIIEEFIPGVKEVPSCQFYLHKSGEIHWVGTTCGRFNGCEWISAWIDWTKQDYYKNLLWNAFTVPIKEHLKDLGYFGFVTFEVLVTDHEMYLCDLNPRVGGDTTHILISAFMAKSQGLYYSCITVDNHFDASACTIVDRTNQINASSNGLAVVLAAADIDDNKGCICEFSIFGKTLDDVEEIKDKIMENKQ